MAPPIPRTHEPAGAGRRADFRAPRGMRVPIGRAERSAAGRAGGVTSATVAPLATSGVPMTEAPPTMSVVSTLPTRVTIPEKVLHEADRVGLPRERVPEILQQIYEGGHYDPAKITARALKTRSARVLRAQVRYYMRTHPEVVSRLHETYGRNLAQNAPGFVMGNIVVMWSAAKLAHFIGITDPAEEFAFIVGLTHVTHQPVARLTQLAINRATGRRIGGALVDLVTVTEKGATAEVQLLFRTRTRQAVWRAITGRLVPRTGGAVIRFVMGVGGVAKAVVSAPGGLGRDLLIAAVLDKTVGAALGKIFPETFGEGKWWRSAFQFGAFLVGPTADLLTRSGFSRWLQRKAVGRFVVGPLGHLMAGGFGLDLGSMAWNRIAHGRWSTNELAFNARVGAKYYGEHGERAGNWVAGAFYAAGIGSTYADGVCGGTGPMARLHDWWERGELITCADFRRDMEREYAIVIDDRETLLKAVLQEGLINERDWAGIRDNKGNIRPGTSRNHLDLLTEGWLTGAVTLPRSLLYYDPAHLETYHLIREIAMRGRDDRHSPVSDFFVEAVREFEGESPNLRPGDRIVAPGQETALLEWLGGAEPILAARRTLYYAALLDEQLRMIRGDEVADVAVLAYAHGQGIRDDEGTIRPAAEYYQLLEAVGRGAVQSGGEGTLEDLRELAADHIARLTQDESLSVDGRRRLANELAVMNPTVLFGVGSVDAEAAWQAIRDAEEGWRAGQPYLAGSIDSALPSAVLRAPAKPGLAAVPTDVREEFLTPEAQGAMAAGRAAWRRKAHTMIAQAALAERSVDPLPALRRGVTVDVEGRVTGWLRVAEAVSAVDREIAAAEVELAAWQGADGEERVGQERLWSEHLETLRERRRELIEQSNESGDGQIAGCRANDFPESFPRAVTYLRYATTIDAALWGVGETSAIQRPDAMAPVAWTRAGVESLLRPVLAQYAQDAETERFLQRDEVTGQPGLSGYQKVQRDAYDARWTKAQEAIVGQWVGAVSAGESFREVFATWLQTADGVAFARSVQDMHRLEAESGARRTPRDAGFGVAEAGDLFTPQGHVRDWEALEAWVRHQPETLPALEQTLANAERALQEDSATATCSPLPYQSVDVANRKRLPGSITAEEEAELHLIRHRLDEAIWTFLQQREAEFPGSVSLF